MKFSFITCVQFFYEGVRIHARAGRGCVIACESSPRKKGRFSVPEQVRGFRAENCSRLCSNQGSQTNREF